MTATLNLNNANVLSIEVRNGMVWYVCAGGTTGTIQVETDVRWDDLTELELSGNPLEHMPPLPPRLVILDVQTCRLRELPPLPETLRVLRCNNNQLETLPPLPDRLRLLNVDFNRLTVLQELPGMLLSLHCAGNLLGSLPAVAQTVIDLEADGNPFTYGINRDAIPPEHRFHFEDELYDRYDDYQAFKIHRQRMEVLREELYDFTAVTTHRKRWAIIVAGIGASA